MKRVYIGTSGYNYPAWRGRFYPERLSPKKMLSFYAEIFPTVEINYTFYRMPAPSGLEAWAAATPGSFRFALKASQRITHRNRLKDSAELVDYFWTTAAALGDKLGPILYQLPPNLKLDIGRLEAFLEQLPAGSRSAFEFRHPSWFDDQVLDALRRAGACLCVADTDDLQTPLERTAGFGYLRLRRPDYDATALDAWAARIRDACFLEEVFIYFKHEDEARGPALARELMGRLS